MSEREPHPHHLRETVGGIMVALAALQFGVVIILGKQLGDVADPIPVEAMLSIRFGVSALVLAAALAATRRPLLAAEGERRGLALLAIFGYGTEATFFFLSLRHGTAAAVTLLFFLYPVVVAIFSWLAGSGRPNRLTIVALLAAMTGAAIVVVTGAGLAIEPIGILFAFTSATIYAAYLVGSDVVLRRTPALTSGMWVGAGASLGLFVWALVAGRWRLPSDGREWIAIVAMGIATAGAFFGLMERIRRIGALRTAIVSALEPLAASLLAWLVLREVVTGGVLLGGTFILAGAITASLARRATPQEQQIP